MRAIGMQPHVRFDSPQCGGRAHALHVRHEGGRIEVPVEYLAKPARLWIERADGADDACRARIDHSARFRTARSDFRRSLRIFRFSVRTASASTRVTLAHQQQKI